MISLKRNDYEPDLCFFKKGKAEKFEPNQLLFPAPDLVVEILSKSTETNDRGVKFEDYAANGIPEYWIIDPDKKTIEQYLSSENEYQLNQKTDNGIITSQEIEGLKLPAGAVFNKVENKRFLKEVFKLNLQ